MSVNTDDCVLTLKLRPRNLDELVGQEEVVRQLRAQLASGRIPRAYLISGETGSGKSSLAYILALLLQGELTRTLTAAEWDAYETWDILEGNAADHTGVDAMRTLIASTYQLPRWPSVNKIFIINEAHRLTRAAQEALKVPMEKEGRNFWILTAVSPLEIIAELRRRCARYHMKPLTPAEMQKMLEGAARSEKLAVDVTRLRQALASAGITSPALGLGALEKVAAGASYESAVEIAAGETASKQLTRDLLRGDWPKLAAGLKDMSGEEIVGLRYQMLAILKNLVLKGESHAGWAARVIGMLGERGPDEPPALVPWIVGRLYEAAQIAKGKP